MIRRVGWLRERAGSGEAYNGQVVRVSRMDRRDFLALIGSGLCARAGQVTPDHSKADVTLRISPVEIEIAPPRTIKTIGYNGSAPGPVLRLREGQSVTVDVHNETQLTRLSIGTVCSSLRRWMAPRKKERPWFHHVAPGGTRSCRALRERAGITRTSPPAGT